MCLGVVTDMNETLNTVRGDSSDAAIDLGYEKNFHIGLSDYESFYIPIAPTLSGESATAMIADEEAVDHIYKNHPKCDINHGCVHGAAART